MSSSDWVNVSWYLVFELQTFNLRARCTEAKSYRYEFHGGRKSRWIKPLWSERKIRSIGLLWLSIWEVCVYSAAVVLLLWFLWTVVICTILVSLVIIWNFFGGYELWVDENFTMCTNMIFWAPAPAFGIVQWRSSGSEHALFCFIFILWSCCIGAASSMNHVLALYVSACFLIY